MLQYELHIRKLASRKVLFEQADFATALAAAKDDVQLRARWFITPTAILASSSSAPKRNIQDSTLSSQQPQLSKKKQRLQTYKEGKSGKGAGSKGTGKGATGGNSKGGGKGNKGAAGKNANRGGQFKKTPDGRLICNFWNSAASCSRQGCTFVHVCAACYSPDHTFQQCTATGV
jgi:hypothetical protein